MKKERKNNMASAVKLLQSGYQYNDIFPNRKRAERRAEKYKEMGYDAKIVKTVLGEYSVYVKKEV